MTIYNPSQESDSSIATEPMYDTLHEGLCTFVLYKVMIINYGFQEYSKLLV